MEKVEVLNNGETVELVTKVDEEEIEMNLIDPLEDTIDLTEALEKTMELNLGD